MLASALMASSAPAYAQSETAPTLPQAPVSPVDLVALLRGEPGGLTADGVAQAAIQTAPSIAQSRAVLAQSRAGAAEAYLAFFPRFEVTARYTRLSEIQQASLSAPIPQSQIDQLRALIATVPDASSRTLFGINLDAQLQLANLRFPVLLNQFSLGGTLSYPVSDVFLTVLPAYEGTERLVDASRAQLLARTAEVAQQAREAFYNYARARAAVEVARATVALIEAQERVVQANVTAGTVAQVDLLSLQAQRARAEVAVTQGEGGLAAAAEALRTLLHDRSLGAGGSIAIGEDLMTAPDEVAGSEDELVHFAIDHRPEAEALRALLHARQRSIEVADAMHWPHLVVSGTLSFDNPSQRIFPQQERFVDTWSLSAILTWSPNDFFVAEQRLASAHAQQDQTAADLASFEDALRMQVAAARTAYRVARASLVAAQAGILAAEESVRVRSEQARLGTGLVTDLMTANATLAQAQLDLVTAAIGAHIAHAQLERAIGADGPYE
jgi:outer membrane protein TolC